MTYPQKVPIFFPKKNKKNSYTSLGNFPLSQKPRKQRIKSDGDQNFNREQNFVTNHNEF